MSSERQGSSFGTRGGRREARLGIGVHRMGAWATARSSPTNGQGVGRCWALPRAPSQTLATFPASSGRPAGCSVCTLAEGLPEGGSFAVGMVGRMAEECCPDSRPSEQSPSWFPCVCVCGYRAPKTIVDFFRFFYQRHRHPNVCKSSLKKNNSKFKPVVICAYMTHTRTHTHTHTRPHAT